MLERSIELVGFGHPVGKNAVEGGKRIAEHVGGLQTQPDAGAASGRNSQLVMKGALAAFRVPADSGLVAANDVVVDAVLETPFDGQAAQPAVVGLILAEQ